MLKKTTLWLLSVMMLLTMLVAGCGGEEKKAANDSQKLIVYTSMKESLIKGIVDGFKKANPGIDVDYQSAGAGKLMAKIAAERQSGKILADVIWTSEVPDFYNMKNEGILLNYKSPVEPETVNPFSDYDGSFHAARLGTLGIVINTDKIKTAPTQWSDLMKPDFKDRFGIANPALSGTSYMSVALLEKQFGCPVRAWYSNEENGIMGLQNEKDEGYRIDTETYYYEILKMDSDEPAEPGELGRIVITDLFNYAFPILRYDNGDTAVARKRMVASSFICPSFTDAEVI